MKLITLLAVLVSTTAFAQPTWETIAIPMSDGQELAADVYLPAEGQEYPVIFIQTPYNKNVFHLGLPLGVGWNQEDSDYAFVVMDWRCYFESADACDGQPDNGADGYDAVEWIAEQSWCDGNIGTWGPSALGSVQFNTARNQPPHLVCCVPEVVAPQQRYQRLFTGGAARLELIQQLGELFGLEEVYAAIPYYSLLWQIAEAETMYPEEIEVPMFLVGGWYDINCEDVMIMYDTLKALSPASADHHVMMGPWVHGGNGPAFVGSETQGELSYPDATEMYTDQIWKFFDHHLRGIDNGWDSQNPVTYYMLNDGWGTASTWPPADIMDYQLFLHPNGELLFGSPPSGSNEVSYEYDPEDPSPTIGGQVLSLDQGPFDQTPVEMRDDNAIFDFYPGIYPFQVKGSIQAKLYVSSDQVDTDFVVRLIDRQGGTSYKISSTIQRMRFLEGYYEDDQENLIPGQVYEINLTLPPVACFFEEGFRIIISSSNYPKYNRNMNNGGVMYPDNDLDVLVNPLVATNTIYMSPEYPSHLIMPLTDNPLSLEKPGKESLQLYPNPAQDQITFDTAPGTEWIIFNARGERVLTGRSVQSRVTASIDHLPAGRYELLLVGGESVSFVKH